MFNFTFNYIKRLKEDSFGWVQRGWINSNTRELILNEAAVSKSHISGMFIMGCLGALFIGLGVIMFFAANWDAIPRFGKVALAIAPLPICGLAAAALEEKGMLRSAYAAQLLLALLVGPAIMTVGMVYNISSDGTALLLTWSVSALLIALLGRNQLAYIVAMITSVILIFVSQYSWLAIGGSAAVFAVSLIMTEKRQMGFLAIFMPLFPFLWWGKVLVEAMPKIDLENVANITTLSVSAFELGIGLMLWKEEKWELTAKWLSRIGLLVFLGGLIISLGGPRYYYGAPFSLLAMPYLGYGTLAISAIAILTGLSFTYTNQVISWSRIMQAVVLIFVAVLGVRLTLEWPLGEIIWPRLVENIAATSQYMGTFYRDALEMKNIVMLYNTALTAALVIGVIQTPHMRDRLMAIIVGLGLSAQVIHMYFTTLYTLMNRSIAFIGAGILLLGIAVMMEWLRRHMGKAKEQI